MKTEILISAIEALAVLCNKPFHEKAPIEWLRVFSNVTDEEFLSAYAEFVDTQENSFLPVPGQIKRLIIKQRLAKRIAGLPTVTEAVAEIREKAAGRMLKPWSHELVKKTAEKLGLSRLGHMDSSKVAEVIGMAYGEMRKDFIAGNQDDVKPFDLLSGGTLAEIGDGN